MTPCSSTTHVASIERMSIYKMIRRLGLDKTEAGHGNDDNRDEGSTDHAR